VDYVKGCEVLGGSDQELAVAAAAARQAEVAIVVLGENEWRARDAQGRAIGTMGEGYDSATLELTGLQERLLEAVLDTGTPTVAVLINGRALAIRGMAARVPAIVEAWLPGEQGGQAVAEVLFGEVNPTGKLPVSFPRHAGQLPVVYDAPKSKRYWIEEGWGRRYVDLEPTPLFPFGHGLSYTKFEYRNLQIEQASSGAARTYEVRFQITNTGERPGQEVAQLYLEDLIASVATPVQSLRGWRKLTLAPGETQTVSFTLTSHQLALFDARGQRRLEPGEFEVRVGSSSRDLPLRGRFRIE
jgi:beta-glucosidase